ncbi:MAG: sigma-70 family RNA polymerase sigma factor [Planctomycetota bacterium]
MAPSDDDPETERADAFSALHGEIAPRLWSWASVHIGPGLRAKIDPEDLLQEVASRSWRRFEDYDPAQGSFYGWSLGIARKVLGEALARVARGHGSRDQWSTTDWTRVPDDATRATAHVAREEQLRAFVAWADTLERDDRRLLMYRGLEGWSHAQLAELLGVSEATASKRWDRLRERLRDNPRVLSLLTQ